MARGDDGSINVLEVDQEAGPEKIRGMKGLRMGQTITEKSNRRKVEINENDVK